MGTQSNSHIPDNVSASHDSLRSGVSIDALIPCEEEAHYFRLAGVCSVRARIQSLARRDAAWKLLALSWWKLVSLAAEAVVTHTVPLNADHNKLVEVTTPRDWPICTMGPITANLWLERTNSPGNMP